MKHIEDKHRCPHCGRDTHRHPYLMSRAATSNVLSLAQIAWIIVAVLALAIATH